MSETTEPTEDRPATDESIGGEAAATQRRSRWRALRPTGTVAVAVLTTLGALFIVAVIFGAGVLTGAELDGSNGEHQDGTTSDYRDRGDSEHRDGAETVEGRNGGDHYPVGEGTDRSGEGNGDQQDGRGDGPGATGG